MTVEFNALTLNAHDHKVVQQGLAALAHHTSYQDKIALHLLVAIAQTLAQAAGRPENDGAVIVTPAAP